MNEVTLRGAFQFPKTLDELVDAANQTPIEAERLKKIWATLSSLGSDEQVFITKKRLQDAGLLPENQIHAATVSLLLAMPDLSPVKIAKNVKEVFAKLHELHATKLDRAFDKLDQEPEFTFAGPRPLSWKKGGNILLLTETERRRTAAIGHEMRQASGIAISVTSQSVCGELRYDRGRWELVLEGRANARRTEPDRFDIDQLDLHFLLDLKETLSRYKLPSEDVYTEVINEMGLSRPAWVRELTNVVDAAIQERQKEVEQARRDFEQRKSGVQTKLAQISAMNLGALEDWIKQQRTGQDSNSQRDLGLRDRLRDRD